MRWARLHGAWAVARCGRARLVVRPEPGTREWRADVHVGRGTWQTWRGSPRAARAAAVALARRLGAR